MLSAVMKKLLIVGCGVTGSCTAARLSKELGEKCSVTFWEKSRGIGGRMATSRCPDDESCTADLGAQYISSTPKDYNKNLSLYEELVKLNILKPMEGLIEGEPPHPAGTRHFVPPQGTSALVRYFLNQSAAKVEVNRQLSAVRIKEDLVIASTEDGMTEEFHGIILTQPVPQILQLGGELLQLEQGKKVKEKMEAVEYSCRFAMALYYDKDTRIELPWIAKYFSDPVARFIAVDSAKRGRGDVAPSLVVHTSVPFGLTHLEEDKDQVCSNLILPRVQELVPELPAPKAVKNHKWRYSQIYQPYEGSPGCLVLHSHAPLVVFGGDSFNSSSKFDNCLHSAEKVAETVKASFKT